jgi:peroxiredoxin
MKLPILILAAGALAWAAGDYSNRRAPGFSLADSHYQQHDPQDYRGKVLLIDIMSAKCQTCARLADVLVELKARYGDKIGIISDNFQAGDRFAAEHGITWPMVFDSGQMIASYLRVTPANPQVHFPHLFIIDGTGTIRNDFEGTEDKLMTGAGISAEIDRLTK